MWLYFSFWIFFIKPSKKCLVKQGVLAIGNFECDVCKETFLCKSILKKHRVSCSKKSITLLKIKIEQENTLLKSKLLEFETKYNTILEERKEFETKYNKIAEENSKLLQFENKYNILETKFNMLLEEKNYWNETKDLYKENKSKETKIQFLTKKYVKAQPRVKYDEKNVIYILTTKLMKKEGRYILGKATDLTARLSTYNKSDEHEVIYFGSCKDVETMSIVENMVFSRLKEYREQANRERFVLPKNENIELFCEAIKKSIDFFK